MVVSNYIFVNTNKDSCDAEKTFNDRIQPFGGAWYL